MAAILVIEDDPDQRLLIQEELADEGHTTLAAASAPEAIDLVQRTMPDLVVLDLAMPGMDGIELLGRLLDLNNRLPVIIHTAYASYETDFMTWAADAFVVKQGDLGQLKEAVAHVLGKAAGLAEPPSTWPLPPEAERPVAP